MARVHGPPVGASQGTGCESTETPSLHVTVIETLKACVAVMVRPPETVAYWWDTLQGSVQVCDVGS